MKYINFLLFTFVIFFISSCNKEYKKDGLSFIDTIKSSNPDKMKDSVKKEHSLDCSNEMKHNNLIQTIINEDDIYMYGYHENAEVMCLVFLEDYKLTTKLFRKDKIIHIIPKKDLDTINSGLILFNQIRFYQSQDSVVANVKFYSSKRLRTSHVFYIKFDSFNCNWIIKQKEFTVY